MNSIYKSEEIILQLMFPYFLRVEETRFKKLFKYLFFIESKLPKVESYSIKKIDIISGKDKRCAIIINNMHTFVLREIITNFIKSLGNINFLYMPPKSSLKNKQFTYCVINVINYKTLLLILKIYDTKIKPLNKNITINYSKIQGKDNLISYYFGNKDNK